jgi:hypothetical protein
MNKCLVIYAFGYQLVFDDENVYPNNFAVSTLIIFVSKQKSPRNFCEGKYCVQGVWDKQQKCFIATSALAHERERQRDKEKEKGAIECGVREVCKVGNGL